MFNLKRWILPIGLASLLFLGGCGGNNQSIPQTDGFKSTGNILLDASNKAQNNMIPDTSIKFEYFYRGYAAVKNSELSTYPLGTLIIKTDADWHDFMDRYVPGIPYFTPLDFSKNYLVVDLTGPAKPTYTSGSLSIKGFSIKNDKLEVRYDDPITGVNSIWAQNINGIKHVFVTIVEINKKYIPTYIKNVYHKMP